MPLTNLSRDLLSDAIIGGTTYAKLSNANANLGVGDSSTAFAATQTDLIAATNKLRKGMDATFPTRAANALTFQATFTSAEANWVWNEWGLFNSATAGNMYSRKVEALGTKSSGSTWEISVSSTLTLA